MDLGGFAGLYKTSNNLLDWTKVQLRQNVSPSSMPHDFEDINFGKETSAYSS